MQAGPALCSLTQRQLHSRGGAAPQTCYHWPGPFHQPQQELAEAAKWPPAFSLLQRKGEGWGEGGVAPAVCAWGDCHGYALTKQMALLPAGHLNSHRNVGIDQAGCQGSGRWAGALEQGPVCPVQQFWVREADAGTVDRGSICPDTCCFRGKVRAGPACVRMRGWQPGCPKCVCVCVRKRERVCACGKFVCLSVSVGMCVCE